MVKLKLQYSGHLMRTATSLEKTLMLGKIEGKRRTGRHWMRWLDGIQFNGHELGQIPGDGKPGVLQSMGSKRVRPNLVAEQQRLKILNSKLKTQFKKYQ